MLAILGAATVTGIVILLLCVIVIKLDNELIVPSFVGDIAGWIFVITLVSLLIWWLVVMWLAVLV